MIAEVYKWRYGFGQTERLNFIKRVKNQCTYQPHRIWPVSEAADSQIYFVRINTHISRIKYGLYLMRPILIKKP
jgi:hypothetical protein